MIFIILRHHRSIIIMVLSQLRAHMAQICSPLMGQMATIMVQVDSLMPQSTASMDRRIITTAAVALGLILHHIVECHHQLVCSIFLILNLAKKFIYFLTKYFLTLNILIYFVYLIAFVLYYIFFSC